MAVLMENNADPNMQDKEVTVTSCIPQHTDICSVWCFCMLALFVCSQGRTALHWSCNNGYLDAVKLLLGYSAFPNHMEHTEER